jgi:hypothetical protein
MLKFLRRGHEEEPPKPFMRVVEYEVNGGTGRPVAFNDGYLPHPDIISFETLIIEAEGGKRAQLQGYAPDGRLVYLENIPVGGNADDVHADLCELGTGRGLEDVYYPDVCDYYLKKGKEIIMENVRGCCGFSFYGEH